MSKSDASPNASIALTDDADTIRRKIRRAVTDSGADVVAAPDKPALTNLLTIYSLLSGESVPALEERYAGMGYGAFKSDLAEVVVSALAPIQETRPTRGEPGPGPRRARRRRRSGACACRVQNERRSRAGRARSGLGPQQTTRCGPALSGPGVAFVGADSTVASLGHRNRHLQYGDARPQFGRGARSCRRRVGGGRDACGPRAAATRPATARRTPEFGNQHPCTRCLRATSARPGRTWGNRGPG